MFYKSGILYRSSLIESRGVMHGFSAREGGVSTIPHLASLNLTRGLGDTEENVRRNIDIFARAVTEDSLGGEAVVCAHQIHSANVRVVGKSNCGEGYSMDMGEDCDGFVTDIPGVMPIVRVADCVPILFAGSKADGSPVIGGAHAGWRGTVNGIAAVTVEKMLSLGCIRETVRVAIGTHIGYCCYEVGEDFYSSVSEIRGEEFAARHIRPICEGGKRHAYLTGMNLEILSYAGISPEQVDVSPYCTACDSETFFSHRKSGGRRGTMGAGIVILPH